MATISEERQRNAALLGVFNLAAHRRENRPPPNLPAQFRPDGFDRSAAYFRNADLKRNEWVRRAYRSSLSELRHAGCHDEAAALVAAWRRQHRQKPNRYRNDYKHNAHSHDKRCQHNDKEVTWCLKEMGSRPPPKRDEPEIHFSRDWITSVRVGFRTKVKDRSHAIRLAKFAFPSNWSKASGSFFLASELGTMRGSRFQPFESDDELCRDWRKPVFLHEHVRWAWNGDSDFESDNHFTLKLLDFAEENTRPRKVRGRETILDYTYSLSSSNWSKSIVIWDQGGLDVDQGSYTATLKGTELEVEATKSVRFVAPRNGPYEIGLALNLMAPATISMLLSRLNDFATLHDHKNDPKETLPWPERR